MIDRDHRLSVVRQVKLLGFSRGSRLLFSTFSVAQRSGSEAAADECVAFARGSTNYISTTLLPEVVSCKGS
ncbi:hypothetical protein USDA257_p04960 (plasmid) [Sinorhizobium fredii USDA 257]|uniref:Uncharacterized protein n=1 Tax=Sinorhizobium fredii (strain USDA 257) TaxID=1185652 RepID=I3XH55_SINF2|nr:hypothetical protein USDA257_p04960 [Sinorhizobium fredii USDA 257]